MVTLTILSTVQKFEGQKKTFPSRTGPKLWQREMKGCLIFTVTAFALWAWHLSAQNSEFCFFQVWGIFKLYSAVIKDFATYYPSNFNTP